MTQNIHWILQTSIKVGKLNDFKSVMSDMVTATKAEVGTLIYEWFTNEDKMICHISERFIDNDAALVHLQASSKFERPDLSPVQIQLQSAAA